MIKLSFIKLDIEIMNDTKIKMIRKMPDGAKLFELWIGLMCLAMKSGRPGCIEVGDGIPFTSDMLSAELDIPKNTIEMGLASFERLKMIEIFEDSTIYLLNFEKHQELLKIEGNRTKERVRKQKYRDKVRMLSRGTVQGQDEDRTFCPATEKESDTDIEEDIEKRESISGKSSFKSYVPPSERSPVTQIMDHWGSLGFKTKLQTNIKNLSEVLNEIQSLGVDNIIQAMNNFKAHGNKIPEQFRPRAIFEDFIIKHCEKFTDEIHDWTRYESKPEPTPQDFTDRPYHKITKTYCPKCESETFDGFCPECEKNNPEAQNYKRVSFGEKE